MKQSSVIVGVLITVGAALSTFSPVPVQAETFKLTYSNFFPPTHVQSKLAEAWCEEVEKRTGGRVVVQYFSGQTLTKANQNYDGVVEGLSDIGSWSFIL